MAFRRRHFAQEEMLRTTHVPAATQGMNLVDPISALGPLQAASLVNIVKGERGVMARPGWREYAINVGAVAGEVRSIMAHHGATAITNRLFATAADGIYDVSAGGVAPTLKLTFPTQNADSGRGVGCVVSTGGGHFYAYADEANGYQLYTGSTDTWAAGSVTGVPATSLVFVTMVKSRLWFIEKDTLRAWYLAAGPTISGAATSFDLSTVFTKGGALAGIWSWSLDSGVGRDDYVVFISTSGELAMYLGTDPATDFRISGLWNLGGVPAGRRLAFSYGSDLLILTTQGVLPISALTKEGAVDERLYSTRPVQPLFVQTMAEQSSRIGWEMNLNPKGGFLIVNTPGIPGNVQEQFAMSYSSRGWTRLQGLDIVSMETWNGDLYFGTRDGRVCQSSGFVDNVAVNGSTLNARAVNCSSIGGFSTLGSVHYKSVVFVTPRFITRGITPAQEAVVRYDFDIADAGVAGGAASGAGSVWDVASWDVALWGGGYGTAEVVQGATGRGVNVSVGITFQAQDYAVLVGFDVAWTEEGVF